MFKAIRSAKSGRDWTENEVFAFNIVFQNVDLATFFDVLHLPPTTVSPVILNNPVQPNFPITKDDRLFFPTNIGEEASTVDDFAGHILRMLNFDDNGRLMASKRELSITMCGTRVWAKVDITIMDDNAEYLLMMQEDKNSPLSYKGLFPLFRT